MSGVSGVSGNHSLRSWRNESRMVQTGGHGQNVRGYVACIGAGGAPAGLLLFLVVPGSARLIQLRGRGCWRLHRSETC